MSIYKEFIGSFLPAGILEYFEFVDFKKDGDKLLIYLEEQETIPEEYKNQKHRLNGFLPEIKVQDFPIRDMFVVLHIKKRRWLLIDSGEKITRNWDLVAPGTRMTSEFSAFLKELV
jgi:hypothetical protein